MTEIVLQSTVVNLPVQVVGVVIAADDADPIAHVETFLNLIEQWPADAPTAFVVLGAAPGLAEVLAAGMRWRRISVAVERVTGEAALRARSVHVVPFDSIARIVGDRLVVAAARGPEREAGCHNEGRQGPRGRAPAHASLSSAGWRSPQ